MTPLPDSELAELERLAGLLRARALNWDTDWELARQSANALPRLIAEVRELRAADSGAPGTPLACLTYLLDELERLFPDAHNRVMSDPSEPKYIAAISALRASEQRMREALNKLRFFFIQKQSGVLDVIDTALSRPASEEQKDK